MSKISNKELAETLTEKHGLSKQDAEKFVAKMFEEIGNGLQSDKQVKVKGLGTFKVVSVASRKSVDVNTGEPIVIEGRDKINFTPDASMRDDVNRPFAQFDTVVLNDGVDFSAIDKKYEESEESEGSEGSEEETPADTTTEDSTEETEQTEQAEEQTEQTEQTEQEEEKTEQAEEQTEQAEEQTEQAEEKEQAEEQTEQAEEQTEQAEEKEQAEEQIEQAEETPAEEAQPAEPIESSSSREEESHLAINEKYLAAQHRTLKIVCIAAAVVIVLLGASAYYLFDQLQLRDNRIENLEAQMLERNNKKTAAKSAASTIPQAKTQEITSSDGKKPEDVNAEDAGLKPTVANEPAIQKSQAEEKKAIAAKEVVEKNKSAKEAAANRGKSNNAANGNNKNTTNSNNKTNANSNINKNAAIGNYNKDVRIRTGAYNIVGIDHTVTVRAGQTLSSLSRSQLGPGMECYIEAVNGGRTEFKAGEKVKIPKLKLKKR